MSDPDEFIGLFAEAAKRIPLGRHHEPGVCAWCHDCDHYAAENARLREALTGMVAATTTNIFKDKALEDAMAALHEAEVERLRALLVEIREPIEDTYEDSSNWSDLRDVLRKIDAALTGTEEQR